MSNSIKEDENKIEIRIEKLCQQECTGKSLVVHVTIDKEEEMSAKMTNEHNENELGIKCVPFKWTSTKGMTNTIRMSYYDKDNLRFEVLIGININNTIECEYEVANVKETLKNAEVNQRKSFVGIEQGIGENKNNVLLIMHRSMIAQGKH